MRRPPIKKQWGAGWILETVLSDRFAGRDHADVLCVANKITEILKMLHSVGASKTPLVQCIAEHLQKRAGNELLL